MTASALLAGVTAEVTIRLWSPAPRTQIIRLHDGHNRVVYQEVEGVPLWRQADPAWLALADPPCLKAPETRRTLALTGDSILYITGTPDPQDNVGPRLQRLLDAREPGWCVVNLAHSAWSAAQKAASLLELSRRAHIDHVIWEVWGEGPTYTRVGDSLYATGTYSRDDQGVPQLPWLPLPSLLHRSLFRHSRAWEYTTLALGADTAQDDVLRHHQAALDLAAREGFVIDFLFFPDLKGPFGEPPRTRHAAHPPLRALLTSRGAPSADVGDLLRDQDHLALRLDPCCHYNARGHEVVAGLLLGRIGGGSAPPERGPAGPG